MDQCKRGDPAPLVSTLLLAIFIAISAGTNFSSPLLGRKWVSTCISSKRMYEKAKPIVHSLAFGGRGMFIISGRKRIRAKRLPTTTTNSTSNYPVPGNANETNLLIQTAFCIFKIAIMAIVMAGLFVAISGIYDVTIGFPGEGHRNNPD